VLNELGRSFVAQLGDAARPTLEVALKLALDIEAYALVKSARCHVAHHDVKRDCLLQSREHRWCGVLRTLRPIT